MPESKKRGLKRFALTFLLLYAAFTLIPAAVYGTSLLGRESQEISSAASPAETAPASQAPDAAKEEKPASPLSQAEVPDFLERRVSAAKKDREEDGFTLYDQATGQTFSVSTAEFLPGALACEMDLSSPEEALKAQAVAIATLYRYKREQEEKIQGADFACDSESWQIYVPKETMQQRWGEDFPENYALLQKIAQEVSGQTLTWKGEPILAAFFAISSGSTEAVENVWEESAGEKFPYLQAAASPGDMLCDGYLSSLTLTEEEFREAAASYFTETPPNLSGPAEEWLSSWEVTPSGYVKTALLGGQTVSGPDLRAAFSLRSACFQTAYENGTFTFTTRGWGHGVGMSQAGAVFLAKRGADYREILAHYYPGTTLTVDR